MDDNVCVFWSLLLAVMFFYFGFQVRNGKTDILGKSIREQIKPECFGNYCKEISIPLFLFGLLEAADAVLQLTIGEGSWSLILIGAGILILFVWIYVVHKKYKK